MPIGGGYRQWGDKERRATDPLFLPPAKPDMATPSRLPPATVALQTEAGRWHRPSLHAASLAGGVHLPTQRRTNGQATLGFTVCRW